MRGSCLPIMTQLFPGELFNLRTQKLYSEDCRRFIGNSLLTLFQFLNRNPGDEDLLTITSRGVRSPLIILEANSLDTTIQKYVPGYFPNGFLFKALCF